MDERTLETIDTDAPPYEGVDEAPAETTPPVPPARPVPPERTPSRWRPGAALLAAAVLAGGAAGGVVGRLTDDGSPAAVTTLGGAGTGNLAKLTNIQQVLARVGPAVVSVQTQLYQQGRFGPSRGAGSGTLLTADGEVLTNAHVVEGARTIQVTLNGEKEGRAADLIGMDTSKDVALLKIRNASGLPTAVLGSSAALRVGDSVVAIGNALNLGATPTVTEGIVSALNRSIEAPGQSLTGLIQTDAAINPGNSGGPLVDAQGRVVGVDTAVAGDAQNIGFALAIDDVKPIIESLRAGKGTSSTVAGQQAFLGVSLEDAEGGAGVAQVVSGSPADKVGLEVGDVITKVDSTTVSSSAEAVTAIRSHKVGDTVTITWTRNGRTMTGKAELATQ
jgi:putative serine protease PepD